MRITLILAIAIAALLPTTAGASHELPPVPGTPDPMTTFQEVARRFNNNTPQPWGGWLHIDKAAATWRFDCTSPTFPGPGTCPIVIEGSLDLDPHYLVLSDPGCSIPRGFNGSGVAQLQQWDAADLSDVRFERTPVASPSTARASALHMEGSWSDNYGRADRFEAALFALPSLGSNPATDICGPNNVAHIGLSGWVWLVGVVR